MAVLVFLGMTSVHKLSQKGVSDFKLLLWGLSGNTFAYTLLYMLWFRKLADFRQFITLTTLMLIMKFFVQEE